MESKKPGHYMRLEMTDEQKNASEMHGASRNNGAHGGPKHDNHILQIRTSKDVYQYQELTQYDGRPETDLKASNKGPERFKSKIQMPKADKNHPPSY